MKYKFGHVDPWWNDSFKSLDYQYIPHKDQRMVDTWLAQGYKNLNLNGAVHHLQDSEYAQPFLRKFPWVNQGAALFCMYTGDILPNHQDHFTTYKKSFAISDVSKIWRAILFMEDWQSGHYFEIAGRPVVDWKKGDFVRFNFDVPHMAYNMGTKPRYTLQITGTQP